MEQVPDHTNNNPSTMTNAQPAFVLEDVRFGYTTDREILRGVCLHVPKGKVTAVMGASGGGKTTLLRLMGRAVKPHAGRVLFNGGDLASLDETALYSARQRMGILFQFGALFLDMTVFDNVAFPLRELTKLPESMIRDIVLMKLNAVGLRGAHHLKPAAISGGMARRVALARAIALDPEVVLYDEPFAGLDPISLSTAAQLIKKLNHSLHITSVIVSHDVHETFSIADHVVILGDGKTIAQGTPTDIKNSTDPLVQQFINAEVDGPIGFHYPAPSVEEDFLKHNTRKSRAPLA